MSLQIRRGTGAQLANITPASGELIFTTDTLQVFVGDGTTSGGFPVAVGGSGTVTANLIGNVTGSLNGLLVSVTGNVITTNVLASGYVSATGNVYSNYFLGDGSQLSNINTAGSKINNGSTEINIGTSNGNANITVRGMSNVAVFANTGAYITGLVSVSGNVIGGNILTVGLISSIGNAIHGNILTAGQVSATGNIYGGNLINSGLSSVAGNVTGGNILTGGIISSFGNIYTAGTLHLDGNVAAGGNISATRLTGTSLSVTGNVSGNYLFGNGSQLSGVITSSANINNGTSNVTIATANGNVSVAVNATSNLAVFADTGAYITGLVSATGNVNSNGLYVNGNATVTGNLYVTGNVNYSNSTSSTTNTLVYIAGNNQNTGSALNGGGLELGNNALASFLYNYSTGSWQSNQNLMPSSNAALTLGGTGNYWTTVYATTGQFSGNITSGNLLTGGLVSSTGNAIHGNILTDGLISATSTIISSANITGGNLTTAGQVSATANITGGNLSVGLGTITTGNVVNGNGNGVGNIGSSSVYFNTLFAKATSAQYADLAECYLADAYYTPGTVLSFGGPQEVTFCDQDQDTTVAGVVSTDPAYIMNSGLVGEHVAVLTLMGRVPCQVQGPITKGSLMVAAGNGRAKAQVFPAAGTIIGKAIEAFDGDIGIIEIVVGRV